MLSRQQAGQQARTVHTRKETEGSNSVSWGVHRAERGPVSRDRWNHSIYNWRGLDSGSDSTGFVTEQCDSHCPGSGLPQQLAEEAGWGNRSTTALLWDLHSQGACGWSLWHISLDVLCQDELCSHQVSTTQLMAGELRARVGAGSRQTACWRAKLPSGRTTRIAWGGGMVGDAWQGRKSHLHNTGDHDIPQVIFGSSVCPEMAAESTSTIFSDCFMCAVCMRWGNEEF